MQNAVSHTTGKTIPVYLDKHHFSLTSLAKENVTTTEEKIEITTISLDDFFEKQIGNSRLDFVKMNIQGAEGYVIEGAKKLFQKNNLTLITEFWPEGLEKCGTDPQKLLLMLKELGYTWRPVGHNEEKKKSYSIGEIISLGNKFIHQKKKSLHLVVSRV